jgi:hypothetical protein
MPLVSYLGPAAAGLLTGSLVVEKIFNLPGLGKFFVNSALQRDYTVVMGMVIVYAVLILVPEPDRRPALCGPRSAGEAVMSTPRHDPRLAASARRSAERGQGPLPVGRRRAAACCATRPPSPA